MKVFDSELARIDANNFPLITCEFKACEPDNSQVSEFLYQWDKCLNETHGSFLLISDFTELEWIKGNVLMRLGKGLKEIEKRYEERFRLVVLVIPNKSLRLLLNGINYIAKTVTPQKIVKLREEANQIAKDEIALPFG